MYIKYGFNLLWVNSTYPPSTPETRLALAAPPAMLWQESTMFFSRRATSFCSPQLRPNHAQSQKRGPTNSFWKCTWSQCMKQSLCFPMQTQYMSRQTCRCVVQSGRELLLHASCSTKSKWNSEPSEPASSSQTENLFFPHSDLSSCDHFSLPMKEVQLLCISHSSQTATVEDSRHLPTFTVTSCATQLPYFLFRWAFRICYPRASGDWSCNLCSDKLFFIKVDSKRLWVPIQHELEGENFLRVKYITRVKKGEKKIQCLPNIRKIPRITQLTNVSFSRRNNDIIPVQKHFQTLETVL